MFALGDRGNLTMNLKNAPDLNPEFDSCLFAQYPELLIITAKTATRKPIFTPLYSL